MSGWMLFQWVLLVLAIPAVVYFLRLWNQGRAQFAYCVILVFGYVWMLGQHWLNCVWLYWPNEAAYRAALYLCYAGMCALGPACVYLSWSYAGKHRNTMNRTRVLALFGTGALFYLAVLSNDLHHLYYTHFSMAGRGYNILFYLFTAFSYICFGYAFWTMQHARLDMNGRVPWLFLFCYLPPVAANTADMLLKNPALDFTPLAYCIMVAGGYLVIYFHSPVSLGPIAAKQVFDDMSHPVAVLGRDGEALYQNGAQPQSGRSYRAEEVRLGDGNRLVMRIDTTEQQAAMLRLQAQQIALDSTRQVLEEQAGALAAQAETAAALAAERRKMEIMQALNTEVLGMLQALRDNTQSLVQAPDAAGVERGREIAAEALGKVRRIVEESKRRPGDEF